MRRLFITLLVVSFLVLPCTSIAEETVSKKEALQWELKYRVEELNHLQLMYTMKNAEMLRVSKALRDLIAEEKEVEKKEVPKVTEDDK